MTRGIPLIAICFALLGRPADAHAAIDIQYRCSPAPIDCSGWYRTPVTVTWSINPRPEEGTVIISGCTPRTITADSPATPVWCEASFGTDQSRRTKSIALDTTAPTVTGADPARVADANGWYRNPVMVNFHGADATSGVASCTSTSYAGPDGAPATVLGTCTDVAGNVSAAMPFALQYDSTAPSVTGATAARKPGHGGWYTSPVRWTFTATDALSGADQCPPVFAAAALFTGTCSDRAGNVASRVFAFGYDATAPAVPRVGAVARDGAIRLVVRAAADTKALRISRTPGLRGAHRSRLYDGRPAGLIDRRVGNGRRYRYTITAIDEAGNASRRHVSVTPGPRLLAPASRVSVAAPPKLAWTPVRGASYYNIQLFRGHRKVLSAWPSSAGLQLRTRWRFGGHAQRLRPGSYRWYVWPGFGSRAERRYGALVGTRRFTMTDTARSSAAGGVRRIAHAPE